MEKCVCVRKLQFQVFPVALLLLSLPLAGINIYQESLTVREAASRSEACGFKMWKRFTTWPNEIDTSRHVGLISSGDRGDKSVSHPPLWCQFEVKAESFSEYHLALSTRQNPDERMEMLIRLFELPSVIVAPSQS